MPTDNQYQTSDTALASFLIVQGFPLQRIDYSKPRCEFIFPISSEIQEQSSRFFIGKAQTDPFLFNNINKKLLRILHRRIQWEED